MISIKLNSKEKYQKFKILRFLGYLIVYNIKLNILPVNVRRLVLFVIQYGGCVGGRSQTEQALASEGKRLMRMMPE